MRFVLLLLIVLLSACADNPSSSGGRIYSYVDAQGHLVQGQLPAAESSSKQEDTKAAALLPRVRSYTDLKGRVVQKVVPVPVDEPQASSNNVEITDAPAIKKQKIAANPPAVDQSEELTLGAGKKALGVFRQKASDLAGDTSYISAKEAEAQQRAKEHDRFVTYHNAEGRLIRQRVDPIAAKKYHENQNRKEQYQKIVAVAARQARSRQYIKTMTAVPANCCVSLLKSATSLVLGDRRILHFSDGEYGWINMRVPHPAHVYSLQDSARALVVKSYKEDGRYLHPYMLFLDAEGVPLLAVNNLFQRRYKETWYHYGYLQGRITIPAKAAFAVFYLPYESTNSDNKMVRVPAPTLVPERGASLGEQGELVIRAQNNSDFDAPATHSQ